MLTTAIMGASLLGRYPFGGALHHQFILFPFLVLSVFAIVDEIVARSHHEWVALAAVSAAVILNGVVQWRLVQFVDDEPAARELETFDRYFGDSRAVYVDQTNVIYFFAFHHRGIWLAQSGIGAKFYALPVIEAQRTLLVLRDTKRWSCDLADRELYGDLRQLIALTQVPFGRSFSAEQGRAAGVHAFLGLNECSWPISSSSWRLAKGSASNAWSSTDPTCTRACDSTAASVADVSPATQDRRPHNTVDDPSLCEERGPNGNRIRPSDEREADKNAGSHVVPGQRRSRGTADEAKNDGRERPMATVPQIAWSRHEGRARRARTLGSTSS